MEDMERTSGGETVEMIDGDWRVRGISTANAISGA
jgi:hypothetical protein